MRCQQRQVKKQEVVWSKALPFTSYVTQEVTSTSVLQFPCLSKSGNHRTHGWHPVHSVGNVVGMLGVSFHLFVCFWFCFPGVRTPS